MALNIGMSVPGLELGLGSDLADQADEERKRRLREAQQKLLPNASPMARQLGLLPGGMPSPIGGGFGRGY